MNPNQHHSKDARPEHVMLDLGPGVGALVLHTGADLHGVEIEISPSGEDDQRSHKEVLERCAGGRPSFTAVFDGLREGTYTLWIDDRARAREVEIRGGQVAEHRL